MLTLIYGGSGSGKSAAAENLVLSCSDPGHRYYIATMKAYGEEGRARVERHRNLRAGKCFVTVECPTHILRAADEVKDFHEAVILVECISNLAANEMFDSDRSREDLPGQIAHEILSLCARVKNAVLVTNNIFEDGLDYEETTRSYIAALGTINRILAQHADSVYEVTAGIAVPVKAKDSALIKPEIINSTEQKGNADKMSKIYLITGGYAQGKRDYAAEKLKQQFQKILLLDEHNCSFSDPVPSAEEAQAVMIDHLHLLIRQCLKELPDPEACSNTVLQWLLSLTRYLKERNIPLMILCDELGCGVVPLVHEERIYRELTGRILCVLAQEADCVERVVCGIPRKIK